MIFAATILTAEHKRALKKLSVPVILVGQQYPGHCCIYHDDYHATRDLTGAVVAMGRRNLGYIGAIIQDKAVGTERFRGYEDAVSEDGRIDGEISGSGCCNLCDGYYGSRSDTLSERTWKESAGGYSGCRTWGF